MIRFTLPKDNAIQALCYIGIAFNAYVCVNNYTSYGSVIAWEFILATVLMIVYLSYSTQLHIMKDQYRLQHKLFSLPFYQHSGQLQHTKLIQKSRHYYQLAIQTDNGEQILCQTLNSTDQQWLQLACMNNQLPIVQTS
ncbi:hypothetical protein [Pseudoalteromonas sp. T1lg23B]|uniref:hypothetical protein n=1 Tax=Pseudoalteromonas sp. T1lg23B TaxID=2077097 RepID=UPI000CF6EC85|nr:hypothetical protein [Pseudoalteromonas sp. T1lg23B]